MGGEVASSTLWFTARKGDPYVFSAELHVYSSLPSNTFVSNVCYDVLNVTGPTQVPCIVGWFTNGEGNLSGLSLFTLA